MAIQFGYVTMFATVFPLSSLFCLVNNLIEIRTDGVRLILQSRRPRYLGAQDIGAVLTVLERIAFVSVIVNAAVLYLTSRSFSRLFPARWETRPAEPNYPLLLVIIVIEHATLAMRHLIRLALPDTPGWVELARARERMRRGLRHRVLTSTERAALAKSIAKDAIEVHIDDKLDEADENATQM